MEIVYLPDALNDIDFWKKSGNISIQKKIQQLLFDMAEHPFTGLEKPEALKHELSGVWSRRINREHRIIYEVIDENIYIHSLKDHYKK